MAKKISKHSRAARRNEIDETDAKELNELPRVEKTDVASAIIRATVKKNEDLLRNKQMKKEKTKIGKAEKTANVTNLNKGKVERALNLTGKLEIKVLKSKQRAKMVQTMRKANWDTINSLAKKDMESLGKDKSASDNAESVSDEDAIEEDKFYTDEEDEPTEKKNNVFALLDEVEA